MTVDFLSPLSSLALDSRCLVARVIARKSSLLSCLLSYSFAEDGRRTSLLGTDLLRHELRENSARASRPREECLSR